MTTTRATTFGRAAVIVFFGTLLLFVLGILFPNLRVWGVSPWAHFPVHFVVPIFVLVALVSPVAARKMGPSEPGGSHSGLYLGYCISLIVLFAAGFYLFRTRLHFLGDGYTLLANLASDEPIVKSRNFGETLAHQFVYSMLSGGTAQRALTAYRIVSIFGGLFFATAVLISTRFLFDTFRDRVMFSLGILSGGYMLLFFGYVEHYSLFVPAVGLFGLVGLLVARGKLSRLWILPPLILAVFLHVFGVILVPVAMYVIVSGTKLAADWQHLKGVSRASIALVTVIIFGIFFYHFYTTEYFFRFAFVPLVTDRFTLEGYTLLSPNHLLDTANLIILLFPGILLAVILLYFVPVREFFRQRDYLFLLMLLITTFGTVFLFDPKLGMPRDWDLLSFFGIALALSGFYLIVRSSSVVRGASVAAALAIALGFLSLAPRVVGQAVPKIGMAQILDYARLDLKKNLFLLQQMHEYYWQQGQYERSPLLHFDYQQHFPEYELTNTALELRKQGRSAEAVPLLKAAIEHHPTFPPSYCNLGSCYLELGHYDSALAILRIANGLRPHHVQTLSDLGYAFLWENNPAQAERSWTRALEIESDFIPAYQSLLELYSRRGDDDRYCQLLLRAAESREAPASIHKRLGDHYVEQSLHDKAFAEYRVAIKKGLADDDLAALLAAYPELAP